MYVFVNGLFAHLTLQAHLLDAINDEHVAILVKDTHITGFQPPVLRERLRVGFWVTQISFHDIWSLDQELTVDNFCRHIGKQFSIRTSLRNIQCGKADHTCRFRQAIARSNRNFRSFLDQLNEVAAQWSRTGRPPPYGG